MFNKFKLGRKFISMALVFALAASLIFEPSIQVFAGEDDSDSMIISTEPDVIELKKNSIMDSSYRINTQKAPVGFGSGGVLNDSKKITGPGIIYVQKTVDGQKRDAYIVADITEILKGASAANAADAATDLPNAFVAADHAASAAKNAATGAAYDAVDAAINAANAAANAAANVKVAASAAAAAANAAAAAYDVANAVAFNAAYDSDNDDDALDAWAESYAKNATKIISKIVGAYKKTKDDNVEKAWVIAAYAGARAAQKMSDGQGLDLEAKLKIAHMAYRIYEVIWTQLLNVESGKYAKDKTKIGEYIKKLNECQTRADALQEVIDNCYSDKVGDIEAQAAKI